MLVEEDIVQDLPHILWSACLKNLDGLYDSTTAAKLHLDQRA
jgi:hypothetical protein